MLFGTFVVDLVIPREFPAEIKKGMWRWEALWRVSPLESELSGQLLCPFRHSGSRILLTGIASTIYYYVVGLVFCVLGYLALNLINRKYDLNKEISGGNPAAGIIVCRNVYWAVHHYKRSDL